MYETDYRASRMCRVLGNPTAYQIIKLLLKKEHTPGELSRALGIDLTTISSTLRLLRNIDLIRYETRGRDKLYRIKDNTISRICMFLEKLVEHTRTKS